MIFNKNKIGMIFIIFAFIIIFNSCTKIEKNIPKEENIQIDKENDDNHNDENKEKEEVKENAYATIIASGDIMFHNTQVYAAYDKKQNKYDFNNTFQYVKKYISDADIAIGNFETVTVPDRKYQNYPVFNSPVETIEALKNAGFDILNTGNNHSIDQGKKGIIETIDQINKYGLLHIGTHKNKNEKILIKDVNDIKIAFLSYSYGYNGNEPKLSEEELSYMVDTIDEEKIKSDIKKAEKEGAEVTVVYIHWGNEYRRVESDYQIDLGNKMIEWGADIIFGSHPHVIEKSEIIKHDGEDKFLIYSLGNFVSDQRRETLKKIRNSKYTEDGVLVKIHLEKNYSENKVTIENVDYIPTWVNRYKINDRRKYEILPVIDFVDSDVLNLDTKNKLKESYKNTMELMYNKSSIIIEN